MQARDLEAASRLANPGGSKQRRWREANGKGLACGRHTAYRIHPNWIVPTAIVTMIFYALAGGKHVTNAQRTSSENWALWSDLWAALVLAVWLVGAS